MGLSPGQPLGNIFVAKRRITDVGNLSKDAQSNVCIKLYFEKFIGKDEKEHEPTLNIYGDFQKDADGNVALDATGAPKGWGSAFKIDRLINHIGGWNQQLTSIQIPDEALLTVVGKTIYTLDYRQKDPKNPKYPYAHYQVVAAETEVGRDGNVIDGGVWLRDFFLDQVAKGKVKNFAE